MPRRDRQRVHRHATLPGARCYLARRPGSLATAVPDHVTCARCLGALDRHSQGRRDAAGPLRREIVRLRAQGLSWRHIGELVGRSASGSARMHDVEMAQLSRRDAESVAAALQREPRLNAALERAAALHPRDRLLDRELAWIGARSVVGGPSAHSQELVDRALGVLAERAVERLDHHPPSSGEVE